MLLLATLEVQDKAVGAGGEQQREAQARAETLRLLLATAEWNGQRERKTKTHKQHQDAKTKRFVSPSASACGWGPHFQMVRAACCSSPINPKRTISNCTFNSSAVIISLPPAPQGHLWTVWIPLCAACVHTWTWFVFLKQVDQKMRLCRRSGDYFSLQ